MTRGFLDQMPTLSKFDPGELGEGSLDPLGLGPAAERIAECLVPGLRARMGRPRFATLSVVGAHACQSLEGITSTEDGQTTFDLAFEWLVVESLVRHPGDGRLTGVPGSRKAQRARAAGERLRATNYLAGPRVFGFTGVYRPFSIDSQLLDKSGLPAENAARLLSAWEEDQNLSGFQLGLPGAPGAMLRRDIENTVRQSLATGHCAAPPAGALLAMLADHLAPREAAGRERAELRRLITSEHHTIRHELTHIMLADMPPRDWWPTQKDLAYKLLERAAGISTCEALRAAIEYESVSTAIEYAFRRLLQRGTAQQGGVFSVACGAQTPGLEELAPRVANLVRRAVDAAGELAEGLGIEAGLALGGFDQHFTGRQFVEALIARHEQVQQEKGKRMWIEPIGREWFVRTPYRGNQGDFDDEIWTHPIRVQTLLRFLVETA